LRWDEELDSDGLKRNLFDHGMDEGSGLYGRKWGQGGVTWVEPAASGECSCVNLDLWLGVHCQDLKRITVRLEYIKSSPHN
jgi:hypothetical protein